MLYLFALTVFIIGLLIGSFLNCSIWRLYKNETILGRSYCPNCHHKISWYDNIPVLSYIILKAKCRSCKKHISWQYTLVELTTAILFVLSFFHALSSSQFGLLLARDWLLIITLTIIFVYDFRWQLIPMTLVWPMTLVFFILNIFLGVAWYAVLISGAAAALFFLAQYLITRKRGLGEGDIWLGLLLGFSFPSLSQLFLILVLSYSVGALVGIFLIKFKKESGKSKIALGPFLAFGAIITLIWGEKIISWYLSLFY